jgi:hypothetical protein
MSFTTLSGCLVSPINYCQAPCQTLHSCLAMSLKSSSSRVRQGSPNFHTYRINVEGQTFLLTELELQSEPDNIFNLKRQSPMTLSSPCSNSNDTYIHADPNIFRLIHAHLQGYDIFPLPPQGVPFGRGITAGISTYRLPSLSKEATLKNLLRDASEFGLKNLVVQVEQEIINQAGASTATKAVEDDHEAMKGFVMLESV